MKRSLRRLQWHGVLIGVLLGWPTLVSAQNTFPASGDVGIGTTTPKNTLHAVGTLNLSVFTSYPIFAGDINTARGVGIGYLNAGEIGVIQAGNVGTAWEPLSLNPNGGSVGIGTTNPQNPLHAVGTLTQTVITSYPIFAGDTNTARGVAIGYLNAGEVGVIQAGKVGTGWEPLSLNPNAGNVGIGTTSPAAKLHVAGDAQVDGNLAAKYQDVAEWVQASSFLPSGVVVVVDTRSRNQVLEASEPYDTRVAGVVSARPGLLLGEGGESKVKVAHSGRVKVKVDSSYGPIAVGDLLVTSPTPGHAMRSQPLELGGTSIHRPGTLLGKALEPLEAGQGEILVLLTLQ